MSAHITITGNLVRSPELKFASNGNANVRFSVANNERWKDQSGNWQEKVGFFECIMWGKDADAVAELTKGTRIIVVGKLEQRTWETDDGQKRSLIEVKADEVAVMVRAPKESPREDDEPAF